MKWIAIVVLGLWGCSSSSGAPTPPTVTNGGSGGSSAAGAGAGGAGQAGSSAQGGNLSAGAGGGSSAGSAGTPAGGSAGSPGGGGGGGAGPDVAFCTTALDAAALQLAGFRDAYTNPSSIPRSAKGGTVSFVGTADWTSGFVAGSYWYMYEYTGDEAWRSAAEAFTEALDGE